MAGGVEEGVGLLGSVAFVEQVVCEGGMSFAEIGGESLRFGGLWAGGAVGVEGVADYKDLYIVLADEAGYGLEVGAGGGAMESEERLRGEA